MSQQVISVSRVVVRFAGDSGDGMQLAGDRFTAQTALFGNAVSTFPDFPAEIRAPAGTLHGVSAFQVQFADHRVSTPGDAADVLVAMNPAALRVNLPDLPRGAQIIADADEFTSRNLVKAGYPAGTNPLTDDSLAGYRLHAVPLTGLTVEALRTFELPRKDAERAKNMFALGLVSWLYHRPTEATVAFLRQKFAARPQLADANIAAFTAGWNFGETTESFAGGYQVSAAPRTPGRHRTITGNRALAYGLIAAADRAELPLFLGSYPITPASDILHELSRHRHFGVTTFQAEDEIAGVGAALGAAFGGALGVTTTSGPGLALKAETIGLAVSLELPLVIVDVQRGGPSTGLPTKTEQADLFQALYGRNGESPVPVLAASSPGDCFHAAVEAVRIAVTYRTPVVLLSDGYLANGSEPWQVPDLEKLPTIDPAFATGPNAVDAAGRPCFQPYLRDPHTLARPWAVPGTPGLEHRVGGLEKADRTGEISYDAANHEYMVRTRRAKVDGIARDLPPLTVEDPDGTAEVLVLGWGSTAGPIAAACAEVRAAGGSVARTHLRHLDPLPADLGDLLARYRRVLVPEMNLGQLAQLLRARYPVDVESLTQVRGMPFKVAELRTAIEKVAADV